MSQLGGLSAVVIEVYRHEGHHFFEAGNAGATVAEELGDNFLVELPINDSEVEEVLVCLSI